MRILGFCTLLALAAPVAASDAADTEPPTILLSPPTRNAEGSYQLAALVEDASGVGRVVLWLFDDAAGGFQQIEMRNLGASSYIATLPPGLEQVRYFVEATDVLGNGPRWDGNPTEPHVARLGGGGFALLPRDPGTRRMVIGIGLGLAALVFLGRLIERRGRTGDAPATRARATAPVTSEAPPPPRTAAPRTPAPRTPAPRDTPAAEAAPDDRKAEVDRFWNQLLAPVVALAPDEAAAELARLASFPQPHPVNGLRLLDPAVLRQRLEAARRARRESGVTR